MIERKFNPGFRIELHQKDLNLALEAREQWAWCFRTRLRRGSFSMPAPLTLVRQRITRHSSGRWSFWANHKVHEAAGLERPLPQSTSATTLRRPQTRPDVCVLRLLCQRCSG